MKVYSVTQCDHFVTFDETDLEESTINIELEKIDSDKVYINGIPVTYFLITTTPKNTYELDPSALYDVDGTKVAYIHFNNNEESSLSFKKGESFVTKIEHNTGNNVDDNNMKPCTKMIDHNTSFQLLRVNPKLTGNIKVVVDSNNNLYLDTFKVSKGLSQRKHRKIKLNPDEYYGASLMTHFKGLPTDDIYKIEDSCYALFSSVNNVGDSYYDKYNSGVRTNTDKLYKENYSILAPLCIRKTLPDFFLIFKCKNFPEYVTEKDRLDYMIKNGELIKSIDIREHSNVGKYVRNIYNKSKDYPGYIYLSHDYNEYNVYNGISLDRGVVAPHYESVALERNIKNQVAMNDWYTLGFERNRIVAKDIINLEFMFDDQSEELFTLSNYFGFYVKLNGEDRDFSCVGTTLSYNNEQYIFDTDLHGVSFNPSEHKNVIYGFSEPNGFHRLLHNISIIDKKNTDILSTYTKKPYKCILSSNVIPHDNTTSYVKIKMYDVFEAGEHYRIIDTKTKTICEIIISNYESAYDYSEISVDNSSKFEIRKISVYNCSYRGDDKQKLSLQQQLSVVTDALNKINPGVISAKTNETDSIVITYNRIFDYNSPELIFERILSNCGCNEDLDIKNTYDNSCKIFDLDSTLFKVTYNDNDYYYPFGFESLGDRLAHATSFIPTQYGDYEICVFDGNINEVISNHYGVIYKITNQSDYNYTSANEISNVIKTYGLVEDNNGNKTKTWIDTNVISFSGNTVSTSYARFFDKGEHYPDIKDGVLRLYQNYPINAGVCSIFPVKDFVTNVYDTNSQISFNENDGNISVDGGRYTSSDNIYSTVLLDGEEEYLCDYIDKNEVLKSVDTTHLDRSNTTLRDYINTLFTNNIKKSDISLIVPYCCKWEYTGTDLTGKNVRVMYPTPKTKYTSLSTNNDSYFLANDDSYGVGYISVSNDVIDGSNKFTEKYINDNYSIREHHNYREYITHGAGSLDDILYLDASVSKDTSNKWSRVYRHGSNAIEFISGGVKVRLSSSNETIINVTKYNGYSGIFICMDGNNPLRENNIELFVDETKEQLAVFYYNGTQSRIANFDSSVHSDDDDWCVNRIQFNKPLTSTKIERYTYFENGTLKMSPIQIAIPDDAGLYENEKIDISTGILIATSPVTNYDTYTRESFNVIKADINNKIKNRSCHNYILGNNPVITSDLVNINPTNGNILNNLDKISHISDMFMFTKNSHVPKFQDVSNIKKKTSDIAVYIKTSTHTRDYTLTNNIISMDIIDTLQINRETSDFITTNDNFNTHPTYCEPLMKDIFNFTYNDDDVKYLSKTFNMDFKGCNTVISSDATSVNTIDQLWIQKYMFNKKDNSTESLSGSVLTLAELKNFSVLQSCFENKMFRTYKNEDEYDVADGVESGYEKNTFFGSRGLQLKNNNTNNTITLTNWIDTIVDENNRTVRLNITESLINYITFSEGFKSNWTRFISTETINKTKYIKNSILKHINISTDCTFKLHVVDDSTIFKFFDYSNIYNYKELNNTSHKLICENDTYYIEINNLDSRVYSATFTIKL